MMKNVIDSHRRFEVTLFDSVQSAVNYRISANTASKGLCVQSLIGSAVPVFIFTVSNAFHISTELLISNRIVFSVSELPSLIFWSVLGDYETHRTPHSMSKTTIRIRDVAEWWPVERHLRQCIHAVIEHCAKL